MTRTGAADSVIIDAPNDRNSIGYSCRQNIGVHRVLLSCDGFFFYVTSKRTIRLPLRATELRFCCPDLPQPGAHHGFRTQPENWPSCHMTSARHRRVHPPGL